MQSQGIKRKRKWVEDEKRDWDYYYYIKTAWNLHLCLMCIPPKLPRIIEKIKNFFHQPIIAIALIPLKAYPKIFH